MKAVIQRVSFAEVRVNGELLGKTDGGFLIFLGVAQGDTANECKILADKTAKLRIFEDENEKMNLSLLDFLKTEHPKSVLVISQFTLLANCVHGNRPDFFSAAKPADAEPLYERFMRHLKEDYGIHTECGKFGADMKVSLLNDGPVTIVLDTDELNRK